MAKDTDLGIYLPDQKKFYYLEAGDNWIGNTVDRVRKALTQRDLIKVDYTSLQKQMNYTIMPISDAKKNDYDMTPIFISKHIESIYNQKKSTPGAFK